MISAGRVRSQQRLRASADLYAHRVVIRSLRRTDPEYSPRLEVGAELQHSVMERTAFPVAAPAALIDR